MSTFIGYTRWKKLRKLCMISKQIITTYGMRYFAHVVRLELKKQGLSIFLPDAKPTPLYSEPQFDEKYRVFLKNMTKQLEDQVDKKLSYNPKVCIIIDATKNSDSLKKTLDSLEAQIYNNWIAKVLVSEDCAQKPHHTIQNSKISLAKTQLNSHKMLVSEDCDYVGFLRVGAILSSFTMSEFAKKINSQDCDILYCDHDYMDQFYTRKKPCFKPDWSPYILRSTNYLSPFYLIRRTITQNCNVDSETKDCTDFDILLQCCEKTSNIIHVALPLVSILDDQRDCLDCKKAALSSHLQRIHVDAKVKQGIIKNTFRINYSIKERPKVSIIIPTANNYNILKRCINSIEKKTNYPNWEIIIIDNSDDGLSEKKSKQLQKYYESIPYTVIRYTNNFNFSKMNNLAVKSATGDLFLFINDDTKVLDLFWLDEMVSIALQKDVGVVGPKLVYSDGTIQHAGMIFLKTGAGFHPFMRQPENSLGYHNLLNVMREYSAVTGACLLVKSKVFEQVGGFDDSFDVYYGDSDLCLKIQDAGYRIIYTPFTKILHEGSFSLRSTGASYFGVESHQYFIKKWPHLQNGDPFYNSNLGWNYGLD